MQDYIFDYSQYKKKINKPSGFAFPVLFIAIILLFGAVVYLKPIKTNTFKYNFVEVGCFSSYKQAQELASNIQSLGGAGFIHYDKNYHVLACFYSNLKDAENVVTNLKTDFPNSKIYNLECMEYKNIKTLSSTQNATISDIDKFIKNTINRMSEISIQFDKQEINFNQIQTLLKDISSKYDSFFNEISSQFKTNSKYNVAKTELLDIKTILSTLSSLNETELKTSFKFYVIDLVVSYCSFLACF